MPKWMVSKPKFEPGTFQLRRNATNSTARFYMIIMTTILYHAMKTYGEQRGETLLAPTPWQQMEVSGQFKVPPSLVLRRGLR
jgi:hypothetical protein